MKRKIILVIGATGNQGSATIAALQNTPFEVRAFVRNKHDKKAQDIQKSGVTLFVGNLDDEQSIQLAMKGVYGVFSVMAFVKGKDGAAIEKARAVRVATIAKESRVQHIVYSSAGGAERNSGIDRWECKFEVEQYIQQIKLPYTFLRPTSLMENFLLASPMMMLSMFHAALRNKTLQLVASADIGKWAVIAFMQPERYKGVAIELAGDELPVKQMQTIFEKVTKKKIPMIFIPHVALRIFGLAGRMLLWQEREGYRADITSLNKIIKMQTLQEWANTHMR